MKKFTVIILLICFSLIVVLCGMWENTNSENQPINENTGVFLTKGITDIEENLQLAVTLAIKNQGKVYYNGEYLTEGHIILDIQDDDGKIKAYTLASVGWFTFENDIFTKSSGSGAIPTVITFSKDKNGNYSLLEYKEPTEGFGGTESKKKMFPMKLWNVVLNAQNNYANLARQQEIQADAYLKSIGRTAKVSEAYVEKESVKINIQASNRLLELERQDSLISNCPRWLGTRERIESGIRYIYKKTQSKTSDGYDLITFKKIKEDGSLIEEKKYKILGSEPQLIN